MAAGAERRIDDHRTFAGGLSRVTAGVSRSMIRSAIAGCARGHRRSSRALLTRPDLRVDEPGVPARSRTWRWEVRQGPIGRRPRLTHDGGRTGLISVV